MLHINIEIKTEMGRVIVAPVSLNINKFDKIALIGEEGNGKSSFLNALINHPSDGLKIHKEVSNPNIIFGIIRQSLPDEVLEQSVYDFVLDNRWDLLGPFNKYFAELMPGFDEEEWLRLCGSFSNGERLRLQLIKLLLEDVDCYCLDEPTNDLDMEGLLWLEEWLQEQEKPILLVSHDLQMVQGFANKIVHFEQVKRKRESIVTVFDGTYNEYIDMRNRTITNANETYKTQLKEKKKQEVKWRQLYQNVSHELQSTKGNNPEKGRLLKKKMNVVKSMKKRMDKEDIGSKREFEAAIDIRPVDNQQTVHHKEMIDFNCDVLKIGDKVLAHNIHLQLYSTDKVVIIGNNGVGKSTLLHAIAEQYNLPAMYQDYSKNLDYTLNPVENLWTDKKKETLTLITTRLGSLKFTEEEMKTPVFKLSGGQKAKLSLLKCILLNPAVLLLDEPTRNLSPLSVEVIYQLIQDYKGAVLAISHDRAFIDACFPCIMELSSTGLEVLEV